MSDSKEEMFEIVSKIGHFDEVSELYARAKETLDSVEGHIQFEDTKVSRLLTGVGLFFTFAGIIYRTTFSSIPADAGAYHLLFYTLCVLLTFTMGFMVNALYPWFNLPTAWKKRTCDNKVVTRFFGYQIALTSPRSWGEYFKNSNPNDIILDYYKDCIRETYLISERVLHVYCNVRKALWFGVPSLFVFLIWLVVTFVLISSQPDSKKPQMTQSRQVFVAVDADNTLWDTNKVFADAQVKLYEELHARLGFARHDSPLDYVRSHDQKIASTHPKGLKYPPSLLIEAIAIDNGGSVLPKDLVESFERDFFEDISRLPSLRPGVYEGMKNLKNRGATIVVFSEGKEEHIKSRLELHNLRKFVSAVKITKKSEKAYKELSNSLNPSGHPQYMIGDQIDRDILYSRKSNFTTLYFEGGFQPKWLSKEPVAVADFVIDSFEEVPEIIENDLGLRK